MKILIIAEANSIHTQRWVSSLQKKGVEILLFSLSPLSLETRYPSIEVYSFCKSKSKLVNILLAIKHLKKCINIFNPDILHAHYASSYGLLGAMVNFHPFLLSVWGSDVYEFPRISLLHKLLIKFIFRRSDKILSTSNAMAKEINKYTKKHIEITPFGVNTNLFKKEATNKDKATIIGNVKTLAYNYGIDILIKAFSKLSNNYTNKQLLLYIVGDGPDKSDFQKLVKDLKIDNQVCFLGKIKNEKLPSFYSLFDIAVFPSIEESFGVAAVEAMACECPVIVSDADGFQEIVQDNISGIIVPKKDINATYLAMRDLLDNYDKAITMGSNARNRVKLLYDWDNNVDLMIKIYQNLLCNK